MRKEGRLFNGRVARKLGVLRATRHSIPSLDLFRSLRLQRRMLFYRTLASAQQLPHALPIPAPRAFPDPKVSCHRLNHESQETASTAVFGRLNQTGSSAFLRKRTRLRHRYSPASHPPGGRYFRRKVRERARCCFCHALSPTGLSGDCSLHPCPPGWAHRIQTSTCTHLTISPESGR